MQNRIALHLLDMQGEVMRFSPAISSVLYRAQSRIVTCNPGDSRLCVSDPNRVYLRIELEDAPLLVLPQISYGGTGNSQIFGYLYSGSPIELTWIYHGPLCGYDFYVNNPGLTSFSVIVVELCYNG